VVQTSSEWCAVVVQTSEHSRSFLLPNTQHNTTTLSHTTLSNMGSETIDISHLHLSVHPEQV